jgi:hypothetical protein
MDMIDLGRLTTALAVLEQLPERLDVLEQRLAALGGGEPRLDDRVEHARWLGVSLGTLDKLRRDGLPTMWVADAPRFERGATREWLKTRCASPGSLRISNGEKSS